MVGDAEKPLFRKLKLFVRAMNNKFKSPMCLLKRYVFHL